MPEGSVTSRAEAAYLYAIGQVKGIGATSLTRILLKYGSAEDVYKLRIDLQSEKDARIAKLIREGQSEANLKRGFEIADRVGELGGYVVSVLDDEYPLSLSQLPKSPPVLYVIGELRESDNYAVSVVGTRKASKEGIEAAFHLAGELARHKITVISGLALGIDTAAHSGALDAGGRTLAVIGTGLDTVYPSQNRDLWSSIVSSDGAIVSQFPPDTPIQRWQFPIRNRLMSGLAQGTVIVEAGDTSGAKLQAEFAAEQGRVVFLMKHQVERFEWARRLVDAGEAVEVRSVDDVLESVLTLDDLGNVPEDLELASGASPRLPGGF